MEVRVIVWWLAACSRDWCGPGTREVDRQCVAIEAAEAPEPEVTTLPSTPLMCGPGTIEVDGTCIVEETPVECGEGAVVRGDTCVGLGVQFVSLPFPAGVEVAVSQGHHGYFSHSGRSVFAVDFPVPEGTEVVAARAGRVVNLYEASNQGCGDAECSALANYVVIDHGDATFGKYWHLRQDGALVEIGQIVGRGEPIALSGNTGWSTGPHLHFEIGDPLGQSLPLVFEDQPDGVVFAGSDFVSGNDAEAAPDELPWSTCPTDLFTFMGVTLAPGVPCARTEGLSVGPVGATALVPGAQVVVGTWSTMTGEWTYACTGEPEANVTVSLDPEITSGHTYLLVAAADEYCLTYQGWDSSVLLPIGL